MSVDTWDKFGLTIDSFGALLSLDIMEAHIKDT